MDIDKIIMSIILLQLLSISMAVNRAGQECFDIVLRMWH